MKFSMLGGIPFLQLEADDFKSKKNKNKVSNDVLSDNKIVENKDEPIDLHMGLLYLAWGVAISVLFIIVLATYNSSHGG